MARKALWPPRHALATRWVTSRPLPVAPTPWRPRPGAYHLMLIGLKEPVLLYDTSGEVIARLRPANEQATYPWRSLREEQSMIQPVIDDLLRDKLIGLQETIDLCDTSGRVVAKATPVNDAATYRGREPRISEEERNERRKYTGRTYTTAEVLKHLESL